MQKYSYDKKNTIPTIKSEFTARKRIIPTLAESALDNIILSHDPQIYGAVWTLPIFMLKALDKRCVEIEGTKEYRKRFNVK